MSLIRSFFPSCHQVLRTASQCQEHFLFSIFEIAWEDRIVHIIVFHYSIHCSEVKWTVLFTQNQHKASCIIIEITWPERTVDIHKIHQVQAYFLKSAQGQAGLQTYKLHWYLSWFSELLLFLNFFWHILTSFCSNLKHFVTIFSWITCVYLFVLFGHILTSYCSNLKHFATIFSWITGVYLFILFGTLWVKEYERYTLTQDRWFCILDVCSVLFHTMISSCSSKVVACLAEFVHYHN